MKVLKVINNNVVSAADGDGHEVVVMGRGIGFKVKPGQEIVEERIEKIFRMDSQTDSERLKRLLADIPLENIQISSDIIDYTKKYIDKKLNKNIYITLTDHISFAIERYKQRLNFSNPLLYEVKLFYKKEFDVGKHAIELIKQRMEIDLPEDEAASIALHIVNAEYNAKIDDMIDITNLISEILGIIKSYFNFEIDEQSLDFERFLTHLKFFVLRVYKREKINTDDADFKEMVRKRYSPEYECSKIIAAHIESQYSQKIQDEELVYLTIHIKRITSGGIHK